jgi:hypothetical protein
MAKQYIYLEVGALSAVQQNLRAVRAPMDFTIENVEVSAGANVGEATFNVRAGSTPSAATTIFASPSDRPKIASGASRGESAGLSVAITKDTWIVWDVDAVPVGGISAPVTIAIRVEDGTAVAGAPGSQWLNGTGAPSGGIGVNGDYYLRTSNDDVYFKNAGAWSVVGNIRGAAGTPGIDGSVLRNGSGVPSNGTGVDGDYYLRTSNNDLYQRQAGSYVVVGNLQGAPGAAGQGFTFRNAWASGTAYVAYDVVTYNGSTYLAIASSTNVLPSSDVTKWAVMASSANLLAGEQDVAWSNLSSSVTVDSNNTLIGSSVNGGGNATQTITGIGGIVRFRIGPSSESTRYAGLRTSSPTHTGLDSTTGWRCQVRVDGTINAQNDGANFSSSPTNFAYTDQDELKFECFDSGGGTPGLRLYSNNVLKKTFTGTISFPLYFDVQFTSLSTQHIYGGKIKSTA